MIQPTKKMITENLQLMLSGKSTREKVSAWAMDYIRNDDKIYIEDVDAWHYLVAISNVDEMISPNKYLFSDNDIKDIINQYIKIL